MREIDYQLPTEVFLDLGPEYKKTILDLGKISIAGFVDWEEYADGPNYDKWPFPLFLLGNEPEMTFSMPNSPKRVVYWHLKNNDFTNNGSILNDVTMPSDNHEQPWVYIGNAVYPSSTRAYLFDRPIPYDQKAFEERVAQELDSTPTS